VQDGEWPSTIIQEKDHFSVMPNRSKEHSPDEYFSPGLRAGRMLYAWSRQTYAKPHPKD
jgi:hypothetical protein